MPVRRLASPLTAAVMLALCVALSGGCRQEAPGLTLREAENMAWAWLRGLETFIDPPVPANADDDHEEEDCAVFDKEESPPDWLPSTLRDCFVDDDWDPAGFRNPTEAIAWLTERRRPLLRVLSIDLVDESAELTFELKDEAPVKLVARVVMSAGAPRCTSLTVGR